MYEGHEPFRWGPTARDMILPSGSGLEERAKNWVNAPFKLGMNLRSHRRATRRRLLIAPDPNLAAHMEDPFVPGGTNWSQVALAADEWLESAGYVIAR
jgi:hypothetical protein